MARKGGVLHAAFSALRFTVLYQLFPCFKKSCMFLEKKLYVRNKCAIMDKMEVIVCGFWVLTPVTGSPALA